MKPIPTITVDFASGCTIPEYIESMLELALRLKCFVRCELNRVSLIAPPMQARDVNYGAMLLDSYYRGLERNSAAEEIRQQKRAAPGAE